MPLVCSAWCITSHFALLLSSLVYKGNTHLPNSKDFTRLFTVTIMFTYGAIEILATMWAVSCKSEWCNRKNFEKLLSYLEPPWVCGGTVFLLACKHLSSFPIQQGRQKIHIFLQLLQKKRSDLRSSRRDKPTSANTWRGKLF